MPTPKAIFYDLDGTLRHNQPTGRDFFVERALQLGLTITPANRLRSARWEHAYWASSAELRADLAQFKDEHENRTFWHNYSERQLLALGCSTTCAKKFGPQISDFMDEHYQPQDSLFADVAPTLTRLRQQGYILAVVSNRHKAFEDYLLQKEILHHFHFALYAGQVDSWKPAPEIFLHAVQQANVQASQAIYVGDNYYADIIGARQAGLLPILFDPGDIFPEADCPIIQTHSQIFNLIERM
jgi:HAD superfamily hydrolase (TIGR01509 family)